jgi:hypothetical protein
MKPTKPTAKTEENEGEGNRTAARNYNQRTREFIDSGKVDEAARAAQAALGSEEREELEEAEEAGRSRAGG